MDFKKYLDDSYKFVEGDDLYKINGGETYEQHMYGHLAYEKNGDTSGGSGNVSTSSSSGGSSGKDSSTTTKTETGTGYSEGNITGRGYPSSNSGYGQGYNNVPTSGSWGGITDQKNRNQTMQQYAESGKKDENGIKFDVKMNGWTKNKKGELIKNTFGTQGCKMQGVAKILSEIRGKLFTLLDVNKFDKDKNGLLSQEEITEGIITNLLRGQKLTTDYFEYTLNKDVLDNISKSKGTTYVLGRAEGVHGGQHWVELEAYNINTLGQVEFTYNGTSRYDGINDRKYILGDPQPGQDNYFKISRIETYTINWEI